MSSLGYDVERFGSHIPTILVRQLIASKMKHFVMIEDDRDDPSSESSLRDPNNCGDGSNSNNVTHDLHHWRHSCPPSIAHFHGAVLFVDISGFTLLSQRLPVDELRYHINAYFKRILDIVDYFGGDIVKFAGDALFCLWQTPLENIDVASKAVVERAFRCGNAINLSCCNYTIDLQDGHSKAVLNVHSGLAMGFMTGLDVGCDDRWEYLLLGSPLQDVAKAEADADVGELVVSEQAHRLLCPSAAANVLPQVTEKGVSLHHLYRSSFDHHHHCSLPSCGCTRTPSGSFKIHVLDPSVSNSLQIVEEKEVDRGVFFSRYEAIVSDCEMAFENHKEEILKSYYVHFDPSHFTQDKPVCLRQHYCHWMLTCLLDDFVRHVHEANRWEFAFQNISRVSSCRQAYHTTDCMYVNTDKRRNNSLVSSSSAMSRLLSRETSRWMTSTCHSNSFSFRSTSNKMSSNNHSFLHRALSSVATTTMVIDRTSSNISDIRQLSSKRSMIIRSRSGKTNIMLHDQSFFHQFEEDNRDEDEVEQEEDGLGLLSLGGELRNVIVMFIHLYGLPLQSAHAEIAFMSAAVSTVAATNGASVFGNFISTDDHPDMVAQDTNLLSSYQATITAILQCLSMQGGHLRQFIVDDKGCVAIATFGLRGAVQSDNAASAVATSNQVIMSLRDAGLGLDAGIGIAYGHGSATTYCGLVGSTQRHEYAVLGPYVNLAARLMSKSQPGEVLCDEGTRNADRDRLHVFKPAFGEEGLKVKGFEQGLRVYRVSFDRARRVSAIYHGSPCVNQRGLNDEQVISSTGDAMTFTSNNSNTITQIQLSDGGGATVIEKGVKDLSDGNKDHRLFGRQRETKSILKFLSVNEHNYLQQPCRWIIIRGEIGYGKSAFLTSVCNHLKLESTMILLENSCAVSIHSHHQHGNGSVGKEPFRSWKRVIRQMLVRLSALASTPLPPPSSSSSTFSNTKRNIRRRRRRRSLAQQMEWENLQQKWLLGLSVIIRYLSSPSCVVTTNQDDEMVEYLPLLSSFHILPVTMLDAHVHTGLIAVEETEQMLLKCRQLLLWLLNMFVIITKKVLVLSLDDIHAMDEQSLSLLGEMHANEVSGVILITTTTSPSVSIICNDDKRKLVMELKELDYESSKEMIKASFCTSLHPYSLPSIFSNNAEEEAICKQIFEMTHGNPLYNHEICKACLANDATDITSFLFDRHCHPITRVEEVICYRFDRFSAACQLILKVAAAACYYCHDDDQKQQPHFTLDMLLFIMLSQRSNASHNNDCSDSDGDEDDDKDEQEEIVISLTQELESMLKKQEFIYTISSLLPLSSSAFAHANTDENESDNEASANMAMVTRTTLTTIMAASSNNNYEQSKLQQMQESFVQDKTRRVKLGGMLKQEKTNNQPTAAAIPHSVDCDSDAATSEEEGEEEEEAQDGTDDIPLVGVPTVAHSLLLIPLAYINTLEQATIYNLMLDDQKESLQEIIARYWEMQVNKHVKAA